MKVRIMVRAPSICGVIANTVIVDPWNIIKESREDNNTFILETQIEC